MKKLLISVVICELAGIAGSLFTVPAISGWYATLNKPVFSPPNWIFAPVWTTLYLLMGISLYLVWKNNWQVKNPLLQSGRKTWNLWSERLWTGDLQKVNIISIFALQYVLNILWSYIFFGLHSPVLAFIEILALWWAIVYTVVNFYRVSKSAAYILLPYLIWVSFAAVLNYSLMVLN